MADEAHDLLDKPRLACPQCGAGEHSLIGHEVLGVYDGVLYWSCAICGHAWNRWPADHGRRYRMAEDLVRAHNERPT
jgi:uncharacterized Zn finger protein